ncbi:Fatty acyl-CoA elongase/Polyunsaturated fatty acid specific elongation enzyme [Mycoemilia scoparia]|uniref:Elongation of fatty acids protein n=1 Tax=Mycoemilia scoparia TaxID=417184 RepID=A0A9W7ZN95_9FUNG|nr:Fatty acyl-CoA elongase/Polyunsaturated fatty acid specific elongation enzyme [Mycoemilia scoparia]
MSLSSVAAQIPLRPSEYFDLMVKPFGIIPNQWKWQPGETWLSTWNIVMAGTVGYLALVFGGRYLMDSSQSRPIKNRTIDSIHNAFLSLFSALLLVLYIEELYPVIKVHGFFPSLCHPDAWSPRIVYMHYLFYLSKWYEFLDTIFLVLKKKPLQFLHVYHHAMTMCLMFTQIEGMNVVSWGPTVLNLAVHVVMYYYYFLASRGKRVWWKKYITIIQITQFVLDVAITHYFFYHIYIAPAFGLPYLDYCQGTTSAALFGCALIWSYLVLFIQFFNKTYKPQCNGGGGDAGRLEKKTSAGSSISVGTEKSK